MMSQTAQMAASTLCWVACFLAVFGSLMVSISGSFGIGLVVFLESLTQQRGGEGINRGEFLADLGGELARSTSDKLFLHP